MGRPPKRPVADTLFGVIRRTYLALSAFRERLPDLGPAEASAELDDIIQPLQWLLYRNGKEPKRARPLPPRPWWLKKQPGETSQTEAP
jgi:hypothetical protein